MMAGIKQEADAANSAMTDVLSTAGSANQGGLVDNIDSLLDLSEFDNANSNPYNSPSMSPMTTNKDAFARPMTAMAPAPLLSASQPMSGPSHQYDQYKQQTGFVPGALADAFAITQNMTPLGAYNSGIQAANGMDMGFLGVPSGPGTMFDFNTAPANNNNSNSHHSSNHASSTSPSDVDLEFDSPAADPNFFFPGQMGVGGSVNGSTSGLVPTAPDARSLSHGMPSPSAPASQDHVRLWPGVHQQAALVKAQAQRQQQLIIQQQRQQNAAAAAAAAGGAPAPAPTRAKSSQATDPIVQQKISQLFSAMRANGESSLDGNGGSMHMTRSKKDQDEMDEDERLLASEEGKKLTSKERRQLRNKVSARAFRSRRKEYITQLEAEIATKVNENSDLRTQNRALLEENKRLSDLTRMLLGSPSFSDFLDRLSANPALQPQNAAAAQPKPTPQPEQKQEREAPKDVNAYAAQQQITMAMIPEQNLDFTTLQPAETELGLGFAFQPQVYAVLQTPDMAIPAVDASVLSGKTSNFVGSCQDDDEKKIDMPVLAHPVPATATAEGVSENVEAVVDEAFENDPAFSLYHDAPPSANVATSVKSETTPASDKPSAAFNTAELSEVGDIFGGIDTEKALSRYELVEASEEVEEVVREVKESMALARIARLASSITATMARLDMMHAGQ